VLFWNVADLRGKDREFWKELEGWEVICLSETWVEEKGWEGVKGKLSKGYVWEKEWARKEKRKGRAKGGILMGRDKGRVDGGGDEN